MNRKRTAILAIVAFVCGTISFFNARLTALSNQKTEHRPSEHWLSDASGAAVELDEKFDEELSEIVKNLVAQQKSLASALDDPCTPDEVVMGHTEDVIEAHEYLIRRVGEHVVELRGKLKAGNRDYLMKLCAETLRGPMSRLGGRASGGGRRNGSGGGGPDGRGRGYGRGGAGRGGRGGYGMGQSVRDRLARRLGLDQEQAKLLQEKDPDFEASSMNLRNALMAEREKLLSMFENPNSSDDELLQQIEQFISTHSWIERRIAEHVLLLRLYLTIEQQKWLIGLCRRSQDSLSF
ncbi:MAG: hypothetical protein GY774_03615 [Planctomycetes bacterium]|nr:hypothetical protein [Planctomycetota bacterium]